MATADMAPPTRRLCDVWVNRPMPPAASGLRSGEPAAGVDQPVGSYPPMSADLDGILAWMRVAYAQRSRARGVSSRS